MNLFNLLGVVSGVCEFFVDTDPSLLRRGSFLLQRLQFILQSIHIQRLAADAVFLYVTATVIKIISSLLFGLIMKD